MAKEIEGKLRVELVPRGTLRAIAEVLGQVSEEGVYEDDDWQTMEPEHYYAAIMRHLDSWWNGERDDPKSGQNHIRHVLTSAAIMLWLIEQKENRKNVAIGPMAGMTTKTFHTGWP